MPKSRTLLFFAAAVALQMVILVGVPARKAVVRWTGKTIYLPIRPVDPYDIMSGYYAQLQYDMSNPWRERPQLIPESLAGTRVYAVLVEGPDRLWRPVSYAWGEPPKSMPPGAVILKGRHEGWQHLEFGIEEFYVAEKRRRELDQLLTDRKVSPVAEVRVDARGDAALVRLHIGKAVFD